MTDRNRFVNDLAHVTEDIQELTDRIDDLGNLGDEITHSTDPDMLACYASNSLQATLALLRELRRVVLEPRKRRRARRRRRKPARPTNGARP